MPRTMATNDVAPELPSKRKPLFRHPFRRKTLKPRTGVLYLAGAAALFAARLWGTRPLESHPSQILN